MKRIIRNIALLGLLLIGAFVYGQKNSISGTHSFLNLDEKGSFKVSIQALPPDGINISGSSFQNIKIEVTDPSKEHQINVRLHSVKWDNELYNGDIAFPKVALKGTKELKLSNDDCLLISKTDKGKLQYLITQAGSGSIKLGFNLRTSGFRCENTQPKEYVLINYSVEIADKKVEEVEKVEDVQAPPVPSPKPPPNPKPKSKPTLDSEPKEPADKIAWEKAEDSNTSSAYNAFISEFPDSKYKDEAQKRSDEITFGLSAGTNPLHRKVTLSNTISPRIDSFSQGVFRIDSSNNNQQEFLVQLPDNINQYYAYITDKSKAKDRQKLEVLLTNIFKASLGKAPQDLTGSWIFKFEGGQKPYFIFLKDKVGIIQNKPLFQTELDEFEVPYPRLIEDLSRGESYTFFIKDGSGQQDASLELEPVVIPAKEFPWLYVAIPGGIILLLIIIGQIRKGQRRKKYQKLKAERELNVDRKTAEKTETEPIADTPKPEKEKVDLVEGKSVATVVRESAQKLEKPVMEKQSSQQGGKFRIKERRSSQYEVEQLANGSTFFAKLLPNKYLPLSIEKLWPDSVVPDVFMSRESIAELDRFVRDQGVSTFSEEEDQLPEIGGLLMGKVAFDQKEEQYYVSIEEFAPIEAAAQDEISLEFSNQSLAKVFSKYEDEHPELALVGWFHTHPGHGLFLSKPDLRIQEGFFTRPYQFAMEMDSKSENLDTGFFTWKNGDRGINNVRHPKAGNRWFAWTEIEKFMRR